METALRLLDLLIDQVQDSQQH